MHAVDEMSRNRSIHRMHHSYFYATNCGANCLGVSCLWDKSSLLFAQLPCQIYSGLVYSPVFQQKLGFWCELIYTYPIILKLNWNDPRPKRLGSVHHRNLSRPKGPGQNDHCYLHSFHALIIWIGLLSHSSAKRRVLARNYGKFRSSPHSIKNVNKANTLRNRTQLGIRKMLCVHDTHISKNNWFLKFLN